MGNIWRKWGAEIHPCPQSLAAQGPRQGPLAPSPSPEPATGIQQQPRPGATLTAPSPAPSAHSSSCQLQPSVAVTWCRHGQPLAGCFPSRRLARPPLPRVQQDAFYTFQAKSSWFSSQLYFFLYQGALNWHQTLGRGEERAGRLSGLLASLPPGPGGAAVCLRSQSGLGIMTRPQEGVASAVPSCGQGVGTEPAFRCLFGSSSCAMPAVPCFPPAGAGPGNDAPLPQGAPALPQTLPAGEGTEPPMQPICFACDTPGARGGTHWCLA